MGQGFSVVSNERRDLGNGITKISGHNAFAGDSGGGDPGVWTRYEYNGNSYNSFRDAEAQKQI